MVAIPTSLALTWWSDSAWYLCVALAAPALLWIHSTYFMRCPKCSRRIRARILNERGNDTSHYLYDCHFCRTTWEDPRFNLSGSC